MSTTKTMANNSFTRLGSLRLSLSSKVERMRQQLHSTAAAGSGEAAETDGGVAVASAAVARKPVDTVIFENKSAGSVFLPAHISIQEDENVGSCIICVGSTGTGKSSTVAKYTGSKTKSGSGSERVTKNCEIHRSLQDDDDPVWVDTVGWDDAECEDDETFKDILRFIDKFNITKVKAVIWNISPNVRKDALLCGQARLINMFKEEDIWKNVIIIAKQSLNPDHDCQGALKAGEKYTKHKISYTGYRFYDDPTLSPKQREHFVCPETRLTYNIKSDEEVREVLEEKLAELGNPLQVVFKTKKCVVCSARGDARLLSAYCHMESTMIHPGVIENHHPGGHEKYHPSSNYVVEHDGRLKKNWYSSICCGTMRKPRYTCCRRRADKSGCKRKWACCKSPWEEEESVGCQVRHSCCGALVSKNTGGCSPRYQCCFQEVNSEGCKKVCRKCGNDWGTNAGTCFRKDHELVDINQPDPSTLTNRFKRPGVRIEEGDDVDAEGQVKIQSAPADLEPEAVPLLSRGTRIRKSIQKKLVPIVIYHNI